MFLTEVVDVFKQFTSVSIPGGFKFSLSPRKTADEPLSSFNTGEVQVPDQEASVSMSDVSDKTGLFTFAVNRDVTLRGVVIFTGKDQESCQVYLSMTKRGKKIKQIKSKIFMQKETLDSESHGEVNVLFNRPLNLLKNTCCTIEIETDSKTIEIVDLFVGISPSSQPRQRGVDSQCREGHCLVPPPSVAGPSFMFNQPWGGANPTSSFGRQINLSSRETIDPETR